VIDGYGQYVKKELQLEGEMRQNKELLTPLYYILVSKMDCNVKV
jgi:hypothetical protein